ncbi:hypothetical protein V5O48_013296 [Marasmius crinis-equi]|uniref:Uncharacterized protein n=1 Tax=Marasmius crinis-equi TaxID=585013 RepID=A0ABR3F0G7_9AGAR
MAPTRTSPRKPTPSQRQLDADKTTQKAKRAPQRCLRCPGPDYPLRSECTVHSKNAGKRKSDANKDRGATPPFIPQEPGPLFLDHSQTRPEGTDVFFAPPAPQEFQEFEDAFSAPGFPTPPLTETEANVLLDGLHRRQRGLQANLQLQNALGDLTVQSPDPSTPRSVRTPDLDYSSPSASPVSSPCPATPSPPSRMRVARTYIDGKRQRPTLDNPVYGMMSAKKGSAGYDVVRTGSLLGRVERKDMNRRYVRTMDRILLNCEKLCDETDCWLYIAAHHPSSQGEYIHFTSPSMQKDLPPQAREYLDNTSSTLFSALKTARCQDVASVELAASKARAERDAALNAAAHKQRVIDRLHQAIREQGVDLSGFDLRRTLRTGQLLATRHRGINVRGCNTESLLNLALAEGERYRQLEERLVQEAAAANGTNDTNGTNDPTPRTFVRLEDLSDLAEIQEEEVDEEEEDQGEVNVEAGLRADGPRARQRQRRREKRAKSGLAIKGVAQVRIDEAKEHATRSNYVIPRRVVWTGPNVAENAFRTGPITKEEVLAMPGMELIQWDGTTTEYVCIEDSDAPIVTMGALPATPEFDQHQEDFDDAVESAYEEMVLKDEEHRRGKYATERAGFSFGGGQTKPSNLLPRVPKNSTVTKHLLNNPSVQAVVGYADYMFKANYTRLHSLYRNVNTVLVDKDPSLKPAFGDKSVFAACHFNFHNVVTAPHRDYKNLVFGMCCVYATGDYDYREGGHLILWDLGLVIEFPPGTFIFLPSALLEHSNVCIREGERRSSMVLFSASGLFRWVHNGGMSDTKFEERLKLARDRDDDEEAGQLLKDWKAYKKSLPQVGLHFLSR